MKNNLFRPLLFFVIIVNFTGLFGNILNYDSALYAVISKSFSDTNNYLDIYVNNLDWLDKPHFPFWLCALSIEVFGATNFAYKLPSFLLFLVGLWYTYQLSAKLYGVETAKIACLLLGASLHIIISNNDTRAEAILLGLVMGAVYYMFLLTTKYSFKNLVLGALFSAFAIMTKGIFVLIIVYSALYLHFIATNNFKSILQWRWLLLFGLTVLFIIPELYAVFRQFDLHPEKIIFGRNQVSGVQFFLWDSQFGRFFNNGPIKGKGDLLFFMHTLLWAFAPWAILAFYVLYQQTKKLIQGNKRSEYVTYFGFLIMFIVFSVSKFQLSHYTNILFPFLCISLAKSFISYSKNKIFLKLAYFSVGMYSLLFSFLIVTLNLIFRPNYLSIGWILSGFIIISSLFFLKAASYKNKNISIILGCISSLLFGLYVNTSMYPSLLKYQSGSEIAMYLNKNYPHKTVKTTYYDWALEYYCTKKIVFLDTKSWLQKNQLLLTDEKFIKELRQKKILFKTLKVFENFHVTKLNFEFLNSTTRSKALNLKYLIQIID